MTVQFPDPALGKPAQEAMVAVPLLRVMATLPVPLTVTVVVGVASVKIVCACNPELSPAAVK